MAISSSGGAEVQRPLATVVIGGLLTATFLTLVILPILYYWLEKWQERKSNRSAVSKGGAMVLLLIIGLSFSGQAQNRTLDLENAISMALSNHPNIKAVTLDVEKNQSLQNLKYNLGTTDISYQGEGLFDTQFGQQLNQIGFVQNFPSPSVTKAQNKLQDAYVGQSSTQKQITENELKWKVKQIYFDIQYKKELEKLYRNLVATYKEYHRKATVRVKAGAVNRIEVLTLQSKWKEYELLLNQAKIEIANLDKRFQLLIVLVSRTIPHK
jgi:cobalt-zinc-cadmium resistance protein CzcA